MFEAVVVVALVVIVVILVGLAQASVRNILIGMLLLAVTIPLLVLAFGFAYGIGGPIAAVAFIWFIAIQTKWQIEEREQEAKLLKEKSDGPLEKEG